jgi:hypothetical protein
MYLESRVLHVSHDDPHQFDPDVDENGDGYEYVSGDQYADPYRYRHCAASGPGAVQVREQCGRSPGIHRHLHPVGD